MSKKCVVDKSTVQYQLHSSRVVRSKKRLLRLLDDIVVIVVRLFLAHALASCNILRLLCQLLVGLQVIERDYLVTPCSWALLACDIAVVQELSDGSGRVRMTTDSSVRQNVSSAHRNNQRHARCERVRQQAERKRAFVVLGDTTNLNVFIIAVVTLLCYDCQYAEAAVTRLDEPAGMRSETGGIASPGCWISCRGCQASAINNVQSAYVYSLTEAAIVLVFRIFLS